jgi:glucose/arabinose dehydrogenase
MKKDPGFTSTNKIIAQSFIISVLFLFSFLHVSCQEKTSLVKDSPLVLPKGFTATLVAESLGHGRHVVINSNGDIYVSLSRVKNGGGIVALRDTNKDGKADIIKYFGKFSGTGIGIYDNHLYVGADTIIVRYKLRPGDLLPEEKYEVIAYGFQRTHQHETKPFTFDKEGHMYVTVGAPSNACQTPDRTPGTPGTDPCPLLTSFAGIWRFDAKKQNQHQMVEGYRYATGLRNCVAIHWSAATNQLFALMHGRDQLHEFWPALYNEDEGVNLPAEEFFQLKEGSDGGWPYCYYDDKQNKKLLAPEYGGDAKTTGRCESKTMPIMAFPAHYAPNDLMFYTGNQFPAYYKNGAFIAFHGSWNRSPQEQKGYNVVFVPFKGEKPSGSWEVFADGFAGVSKINSPGDAKYRPCGLAQGLDGSLYVVEDNKGYLWKISYTNK